jgi:hypothetical protein
MDKTPQETKLLRIIELMENFQNADFEGLTLEGTQNLLDNTFEQSKEVIRHASDLLRGERQVVVNANNLVTRNGTVITFCLWCGKITSECRCANGFSPGAVATFTLVPQPITTIDR